MSTHTQTHGDHAEAHEHGGVAIYTRTLVALLILTALTVGAAYINLGSGNIVIALAIATVKAILVALFFMHLRWEKPMDSLIAMAGFIFLGIFIGFCLLDFDSRNNFLPVNLHHNAEMPLAPGTAPQSYTVLPPAPPPGSPAAAAAPAAATPGAAAAPAAEKK
jgi:cytochrome c oxidase subunit IV